MTNPFFHFETLQTDKFSQYGLCFSDFYEDVYFVCALGKNTFYFILFATLLFFLLFFILLQHAFKTHFFSRKESPAVQYPNAQVKRMKLQGDRNIDPSNLKKGKPVGLRNIGNTCYMNSVIQSLYHVPEFWKDKQWTANNTKPQGLLQTFRNLLMHMGSVIQSLYHAPKFWKDKQWTANKTKPQVLSETFRNLLIHMENRKEFDSSKLLHRLKKATASINPSFENFSQNDALEFLKTFLEGISNEQNTIRQKPAYRQLSTKPGPRQTVEDLGREWLAYARSREDSVVTQKFGGQIFNKSSCEKCGLSKDSFDDFWDLSLSLKCARNAAELDIDDLLRNFSKKEMILCSDCNAEQALQLESLIWELPKILIIHFKRFERTRTGDFRKINKAIRFPVNQLHLSTKKPQKENRIYKLSAIVDHYGTLNEGHYTADCFDANDGKWYNFNDSSVSSVTPKEEYISSKTAYILFYTLIDNVHKEKNCVINIH